MLAPRNLGADYAADFDAVFPKLAETHGVAFYPFLLDGVAMDPALNQADGIHPNAAGVAVIVARLAPLLGAMIEALGEAAAASGGRGRWRGEWWLRAHPIPVSAFKAGHGAGEDWGSAVKACMNSLEAPPAGANLGLLYATDALADDLSSVLAFLRERTGIEHWVGNIGFGVAASGVEYHDRPALSVLTAALPEAAFRIMAPVTNQAGAGEIDLFAGQQADWLTQHQGLFGVVHGDPRNQTIGEIVAQAAARSSGFLVGGMTASRGSVPSNRRSGYRGRTVGGAVRARGSGRCRFDPGLFPDRGGAYHHRGRGRRDRGDRRPPRARGVQGRYRRAFGPQPAPRRRLHLRRLPDRR